MTAPDPFDAAAAFRGGTPLRDYLVAALASMKRTRIRCYAIELTRDDIEAILISLTPEAPDEPEESSEA